MPVKILDGASYTIVERAFAPGQRAFVWVGYNGRKIELTDEEAAELL
jgi:hypothetical protein